MLISAPSSSAAHVLSTASGYASAGAPSAGLRDAPAPAADGYANFSEHDGYASDDAPASIGFTSAAPFG